MNPLELLDEIERYFFQSLKPLILANGGVGIFIGMFLESSFLPIPSELILVTAGLYFDPFTVAFWGTLGSTLGAIVGYYMGFYGGRPLVEKIGPYIFVTPDRVIKAEKKFSDWGSKTVFVARLIPFIPFKVFSITSGILKFNFPSFVLMTFLGTIPRAFLLALLGNYILQYKTKFLIVLGFVLALGIVAYFIKKNIDGRKAKKRSPH